MQTAILVKGIRQYLEDTGLNAESLGNLSGISRASVYRALDGTLKDKDVVARLARTLKIPVSSLYSAEVEHLNDLNSFVRRVREIEELSVSTLRVSSPLLYQATTVGYDKLLKKIWSFLIDQSAPAYKVATRGMTEDLQEVQQKRKAAFRRMRKPVVNVIVLERLQDLLTRGVAGSLTLPDALRSEARRVAANEVEEIARAMESDATQVKHGVLDAAGMTVSFDLAVSIGRSFLMVSPFAADASPTTAFNLVMLTTDEGTLEGYRSIGEAAQKQMLTGKPGADKLRELLAENPA